MEDEVSRAFTSEVNSLAHRIVYRDKGQRHRRTDRYKDRGTEGQTDYRDRETEGQTDIRTEAQKDRQI